MTYRFLRIVSSTAFVLLFIFPLLSYIGAVLLLTPHITHAAGNTYYVATNGDDGRSCATAQNSSTPRLTPTAGMQCLFAGDTLVIAPGTYGTISTIHYIAQNRSGTSWDNPITVRGADPSNRPVLRANLNLQDHDSGSLANSFYWVFQDLIVDASNNPDEGYNAIVSQDGIKLVHVWARNATHSNIVTWLGSSPRGRYFINVESSGASRAAGGHCPPFGDNSEGTCHGMYIAGPNITIDGGAFHDNEGAGIHPHSNQFGTESIVIKNAKFYNNGYQGIHLVPGSGTHQVFNNVFWNTNTPIAVSSSGTMNIFNNTFYGNEKGVFMNADVVAINNIFYNTGRPFEIAGGSLTQSHNLIDSNPNFVNASGGDFHLQSNSPARDAGTTLPEVPCDADGNARPSGSAYDIGAYEYGSSPGGGCSGGPNPTPTPNPSHVPCTQYTNSSQIPAGFGVPWDVTNPSIMLVSANCTPPTLLLKAGDPTTTKTIYVYKDGYVAQSGASSWTPVQLFGSNLISGAWYPKSAQGVTQIPSQSMPTMYYVAYTCTWTGSVWKCGCRDAQCTQSYWQLQRIQP